MVRYKASKQTKDYLRDGLQRRDFWDLVDNQDLDSLTPEIPLAQCSVGLAKGRKPLRSLRNNIYNGGFAENEIGYIVASCLAKLVKEAGGIPHIKGQRMELENGKKVEVCVEDSGRKRVYFRITYQEGKKEIFPIVEGSQRSS